MRLGFSRAPRTPLCAQRCCQSVTGKPGYEVALAKVKAPSLVRVATFSLLRSHETAVARPEQIRHAKTASSSQRRRQVPKCDFEMFQQRAETAVSCRRLGCKPI